MVPLHWLSICNFSLPPLPPPDYPPREQSSDAEGTNWGSAFESQSLARSVARSTATEPYRFSPLLGPLLNIKQTLLGAVELSVWIYNTAELLRPEFILHHFGIISWWRQVVLIMKNTDFSFFPGLNSFVLLSVCHSWAHIMMLVLGARLASSRTSQCSYTDLHQQPSGPFVYKNILRVEGMLFKEGSGTKASASCVFLTGLEWNSMMPFITFLWPILWPLCLYL